MTEDLQNVTAQLGKLHGHAYFRVDNGPLKEFITGAILDKVDGGLAELLSQTPFGLEVSVGVQEGENEPSVGYSVDCPGVLHRSELPLSGLSAPALKDLAGYLAALVQEEPALKEDAPAAHIVRKKQDHDHHEKEAAAARLKVSTQWLKSVIPCTEYSYDEIDGKKYIREYYWSRELIERLFKIKTTKTTPEDLKYVAAECCDGDLEWAKDLIARLKSPNRPEPAAKEQAQKGQKPQGQQQAGLQQAKAVPQGDRPSRSRSRHRKFRQGGKDAGRKPEAPSSPKSPQS